MCVKIRPNEFQMEMLGIFHRILKSVGFNIFMLLLGFFLGFIGTAYSVHRNYLRHETCTLIKDIDTKIEELEILDKQYDDVQKDINNILLKLKLKASHDHYNLDGIIFKSEK